jgi:lipopolysaccharide export LptBFGC system permease protein LptF
MKKLLIMLFVFAIFCPLATRVFAQSDNTAKAQAAETDTTKKKKKHHKKKHKLPGVVRWNGSMDGIAQA